METGLLTGPLGPPPMVQSVAGFPLGQMLAVVAALVLGATAQFADQGTFQVAATMIFLLGGLPHGAFDIHLAARKANLGPASLGLFTAIYVGLFAIMIAGWYFLPTLTFALFFVTAIIHFSEDWHEMREPIFRLALGFAPLCAIGTGHPDDVQAIFAIMTDAATAQAISSVFVLVAPITLLIAGTGLFILAKDGSGQRACIFAAMLGSLFILPPLIGFALFFCAFHTPRHLLAIRADLSDWPIGRTVRVGAGLTLLALLLGAVFLPYAFSGGLMSVATAFQLLAALAMPHQSMALCLRPFRADERFFARKGQRVLAPDRSNVG